MVLLGNCRWILGQRRRRLVPVEGAALAWGLVGFIHLLSEVCEVLLMGAMSCLRNLAICCLRIHGFHQFLDGFAHGRQKHFGSFGVELFGIGLAAVDAAELASNGRQAGTFRSGSAVATSSSSSSFSAPNSNVVPGLRECNASVRLALNFSISAPGWLGHQ